MERGGGGGGIRRSREEGRREGRMRRESEGEDDVDDEERMGRVMRRGARRDSSCGWGFKSRRSRGQAWGMVMGMMAMMMRRRKIMGRMRRRAIARTGEGNGGRTRG